MHTGTGWRERLKLACAAATLATAWGGAGTASAIVIPGPPDIAGTVSPAANGLSDLYLLYTAGASGCVGCNAVPLAASVGANTTLQYSVGVGSFFSTNPVTYWTILGVYQGGGVAVAMLPSLATTHITNGDSWTTVFGSNQPDEAAIQTALMNGDTATLTNWFTGNGADFTTSLRMDLGETSATLVDFSGATANGTATAQMVVPEPDTLSLLLSAAPVALWAGRAARRRHVT